MALEFEFDVAKSRSNKEKHGVDFLEAQALWQDAERLQIPARTEDEARFLLIARLKDKLWSAVFTYRGETVRIISVRRARTEEVKLYESE
jgi:uncharacterized DUF497 family protein